MLKSFQLKKFLILFLLGAILAPIGDVAHVITQTINYPVKFRHLFKLIPFWIPIQFGIATILIGIGHLLFLKERIKVLTLFECSCSAVSLLSCWCLSGILLNQPWISISILIFLCVINYYYLSESSCISCKFFINLTNKGSLQYLIRLNNLKFILVTLLISIIGTSVECLLIKNQVFSYQITPHWLPLLYIHASFTVGSFTSYLNQKFN